MTKRKVQLSVPAQRAQDGAGVTIYRSIGTQALPNLDPFLMLDQFGSDNPDDYIAGFPDHPHRGFITVTYMLDGHMQHRDSMGNQGDLRSGGVQWMKAASGVIHSEMPQQEDGLMRGFQLWLNLPAGEKMSDPAYQEFAADAIPLVKESGSLVKVISGSYGGTRGPINDPHTDTLYLDVNLDAETRFDSALQADATAFVYVFEGEAAIEDTRLPTHQLVVLGPGDALTVSSGAKGARFILVAGKSLKEPITQYGPFVMNTREEIMTAFDDYKRGQLVRKKASMTSTV